MLVILTRGLTWDTRSPGKNHTVDLRKLQRQPGVGAGFTDQSSDPWAQGLEKLGRRKDLKVNAYDLTECRKNCLRVGCAR